MPRDIYNWNIISKDWIQGIRTKDIVSNQITLKFPTHEELCDKYGCSLITIRERSQSEKWYIQRAQFKRKLKIKTTEVSLDDLIGEGTRFDSFHLASLEKVQMLVDNHLEPYMALIKNPDLELEDLKPLSIRDLKDITTIIATSHSTVKSILGESDTASLLDDIKEQNIVQRKNREISKTRLKELTKQLNDAEKLKEELKLRKENVQQKLKEL
jgi:hypothetical protein